MTGAMPHRAFKWLPYDGHRHAIPSGLDEGREGYTLCGEGLAVPLDAWADPVGKYWPTCADCDATWREHEGIPIRSGLPPLDPYGGVSSVPPPRTSAGVTRRPTPKRVAS